MENNYNNYNSNNKAYEYGTNNEECGATNEDGTGAKITHEYGTIYTKNHPENYEQEKMDNNAAGKTPVMGAAEETEILDEIENDTAAITKDTTVDM